MYQQPAFAVTDTAELHQMIDRAGPAQLVTLNGTALTATLVPMLLDPAAGDQGRLVGHIAKRNPQWHDVSTIVEALAIFTGPDAYVSPSLYPTKQPTGKVVPTWNYLAVHAYGAVTFHHDKEWLGSLVRRLTDRHEAGRGEPWSVDDAPADYVDAMLGAIVGIELTITRLLGLRKLSQNRPEPDIESVATAFANGTPVEQAVAAEMRR
jgi:transcriptional regulator